MRLLIWHLYKFHFGASYSVNSVLKSSCTASTLRSCGRSFLVSVTQKRISRGTLYSVLLTLTLTFSAIQPTLASKREGGPLDSDQPPQKLATISLERGVIIENLTSTFWQDKEDLAPRTKQQIESRLTQYTNGFTHQQCYDMKGYLLKSWYLDDNDYHAGMWQYHFENDEIYKLSPTSKLAILNFLREGSEDIFANKGEQFELLEKKLNKMITLLQYLEKFGPSLGLTDEFITDFSDIDAEIHEDVITNADFFEDLHRTISSAQKIGCTDGLKELLLKNLEQISESGPLSFVAKEEKLLKVKEKLSLMDIEHPLLNAAHVLKLAKANSEELEVIFEKKKLTWGSMEAFLDWVCDDEH